MIQVEMSQSPEKSENTTETTAPGDGASGVSFVARNTVHSIIFLLKFLQLI